MLSQSELETEGSGLATIFGLPPTPPLGFLLVLHFRHDFLSFFAFPTFKFALCAYHYTQALEVVSPLSGPNLKQAVNTYVISL